MFQLIKLCALCQISSIRLNRAPVCNNEITDWAETSGGGEHRGEKCEVCVKVGKKGGMNKQVGETDRANELGKTGLQESELGEEEELVHNGVDGAVALMEEEAGWSPAPLRLHSDKTG